MGFLAGLTYPIRALGALGRYPGLRRYVVIPILVNILVGAILYAVLLWAGFQLIENVVDTLPDWVDALAWLVRLSMILALLVIIGYLLARFGVVLGSPWYDRLSHRLERLYTGDPLIGHHVSSSPVAEIVRSIGFELKKLLLVIGVGGPLLVINLIPGPGSIISLIGGIALGTVVAGLDFFGPPLDRRRLSFRGRLGVIRDGFPGTAGFGLVCFGLISVPLLNLLAIPVCVTAGTLYFCDRLKGPVLGEPRDGPAAPADQRSADRRPATPPRPSRGGSRSD